MAEPARLGILVFEGFEELDAVGPYDVFGNAARHTDLTVELLATTDAELVPGAKGLRVEPDGILSADTALDYLVVPGGGWNDRAQQGARAVANDEDVLEIVRSLHADGTTIVSVCTGGMILAAAGLLDGRPAVTHHGAMDELRDTDAEAIDARVVDDRDVVTAGGVTSGIDLALWLTEREFGREVAFEVEDTLAYERSSDVYRGEE